MEMRECIAVTTRKMNGSLRNPGPRGDGLEEETMDLDSLDILEPTEEAHGSGTTDPGHHWIRSYALNVRN